MRKAIVLLTTAALALMLLPGTAVARTRSLRVHAVARVSKVSGTAKGVLITSKTSRASRTIVRIYKGRKVVKTISTRGRAYRKTVRWNLRDSKGRRVAPGTFKYRVTAVRNARVATTSGLVRISKPKTTKPVRPAPTDPTPVTPPTTEPTVPVTPVPVTAEPSSTVEPTQPVEPTVTPVPAPVIPPASSRWVGYYVPGAPSNMSPLLTTETQTGRQARVVHFFMSDSESFPLTRIQTIADHGSTPLVTLEFWSTQSGGLASFNSGSKDSYLRTYARAAKAYGGEIWLRPFHEMNGDWYPWCGTTGTNTPAQLVSAWKRTKDIFAAEGATNVKFVWCVNNDSVPNTTANAITAYWPGDDYVDYLSIDGYNAGTTQSWSSWRLFGNVFGASYATVTKLSADPLFIAETSSVEQGGSKADWIRDMFSTIPTRFPRIVGIVWFDASKTYDWRISSSAASLASFKSAAAAF